MNDDLTLRLSAYLDGEVDPAEAAEIEQVIASNPDAHGLLEQLMLADATARDEFEQDLDAPVSFDLSKMIMSADLDDHHQTTPTAPRRPIWGALAAGIAVFMIGGLGGYALKSSTQIEPDTRWIAAVAQYHAVYAGQSRHLVEVGANESDHIETWLGNTIGASFTIPDLSQHGLTFQGGRLVVANGKPVAQLMYLDANGTVIALCLQSNDGGTQGGATFKETTIGDFDFVTWSGDSADYVVIGPMGAPDLGAIAQSAALDI